MGYLKQLHIDCVNGECFVNQWDTCYMQLDNIEEDYDPLFDEDLEDNNL